MKKVYVKPDVVSEPAFVTLSGCSLDATDGLCLGQGASTIMDA